MPTSEELAARYPGEGVHMLMPWDGRDDGADIDFDNGRWTNE
jgi:hypothetical protein